MRTPGTRVGIELRSRPSGRLRLAAVAATASLVLAACDTTDEDGAPADPPAEDGDPEGAEPDDGTDDADEVDGDDPEDDADAGDPDEGGEPDEGDGGVEPLAGDPTTERREEAGSAGTLAVTDVRIGQHDGFDRVVFDLDGDGEPGWFVEYVDEAVEQGRGQSIEVEGDGTLQVAIRNVTLPPELPDDIEVWDDERVAAPDGGTVLEVVDDSIFEGQHVVFVGTTGENGFLIERFEDPQRVVLDIFHG
jgi:hypothetical protein